MSDQSPGRFEKWGSAISFTEFLELRGYSLENGAGPLLRRLFLESWVQPGFHRFWQVWNPAYGYFLFNLYRALGGSRRPFLAGISVFVICGSILHDLPIGLVTGVPRIVCTVAFSFWGVTAFLSRKADPVVDFESWPPVANLVVNVFLIGIGLLLGAMGQRLFFA